MKHFKICILYILGNIIKLLKKHFHHKLYTSDKMLNTKLKINRR